MKNQKGVTLMYLVATIIILIILASVTVSASLNSYKSMRFDTKKAEMEEIQEAVLSMIEDYTLAKSTNSDVETGGYSKYFEVKYGTTKTVIDNSESGVSALLALYTEINQDYSFYFDQDEIKTYFGLEVSIESVLVDFSTGVVYNIEGFKDENDEVYYTVEEAGGESIITSTTSVDAGTAEVSPVTGTSLSKAGDTSLLKVTLTLSGSSYPIKKAYYSTDNTNFIEVDYLGDCAYSENSVSFVIYETGTYYFKIENTYGKTTDVVNVTYN